MSTALVLSLLIHALLLSLNFGNQEFGLPGLGFPWRERRFEAGDLRVALVPAQVTAATPELTEPSANLKPTGMAKPEPIATPGAMAVMTHSPASESENVASLPIPAPALIASELSETATLVAPVTPLVVATPVIAAAPSATNPAVVIPTPQDTGDAVQKQIDPDERERALELAQLNPAKQEVQQQADQMEAVRESATRRQAERLEVARQAVAREEAAPVEVERQEVARQAAVRQEAERAEAARVDTERQEVARQETARQEKELQKASRAEQEAKREAVLRAIGRQLDEEAARRDAASLAAPSSSTLPASSSSARRGRLFGRTDPNTELILYAEAWSRKIELNMTFDMVREAAKQRHTNPLVTVALRSDGSVESVTFVASSGVAEIDEAIRRIVQSQAPYRSFPPGLAREYDVIEIRRSWHFDMAVRLF